MALASLVKTDFLSDIKSQALVTIKNDRNRYSLIWQTIEEYCAKNKLIISSNAALLGKTDELDNIFDKTYFIYTSNPFRHANELTNTIHRVAVNEPHRQFTRLRTVQENAEFIIDFDLRPVAYIYKLQKHKSVEPIDIIKPIEIKNIYYMPAEIELIDILHKLYKMEDYEKNIAFEDMLYRQVYVRKESGVLGASCADDKKQLLEALKVDLVLNWLRGLKKNTILVGPWAYDWIRLTSSKLCANVEKIQLISEMQQHELLHLLNKYMKERKLPFCVTMREQELHIPKDFRTSRFTYYVNVDSERGGVEKPFLDLFNCANFEIIPCYTSDKMRIGYKYVMLRFLFIDLWIIRVIKSLNLLTAEVLNKKLIYIWTLVDFFRNYTVNATIDFIGVYRDPNVDKKISNLSEKAFYPYYPETYQQTHHKYRIV